MAHQVPHRHLQLGSRQVIFCETTAAAAVRSPISLATLLGGSDGIETSVKALLSVALATREPPSDLLRRTREP
jgi:hypothetical protein